jgi:outer membrane protein assembly factor BamB
LPEICFKRTKVNWPLSKNLDEYTGYLVWSFEVAGDGQSVPVYAERKFYLSSWQYDTAKQGHAYCADTNRETALAHQQRR